MTSIQLPNNADIFTIWTCMMNKCLLFWTPFKYQYNNTELYFLTSSPTRILLALHWIWTLSPGGVLSAIHWNCAAQAMTPRYSTLGLAMSLASMIGPTPILSPPSSATSRLLIQLSGWLSRSRYPGTGPPLALTNEQAARPSFQSVWKSNGEKRWITHRGMGDLKLSYINSYRGPSPQTLLNSLCKIHFMDDTGGWISS